MLYMVRLRDVVTGCERWLDDQRGDRVILHDRQTADCAALAVAVARLHSLELPYVVEIDPRVEDVL